MTPLHFHRNYGEEGKKQQNRAASAEATHRSPLPNILLDHNSPLPIYVGITLLFVLINTLLLPHSSYERSKKSVKVHV